MIRPGISLQVAKQPRKKEDTIMTSIKATTSTERAALDAIVASGGKTRAIGRVAGVSRKGVVLRDVVTADGVLLYTRIGVFVRGEVHRGDHVEMTIYIDKRSDGTYELGPRGDADDTRLIPGEPSHRLARQAAITSAWERPAHSA
jgi:hypothetical protein